jgi:hypothetical protein
MPSGKEIRNKIKSVESTAQDHQGHADGGRIEDAQGAGQDASCPSLMARRFAWSPATFRTP